MSKTVKMNDDTKIFMTKSLRLIKKQALPEDLKKINWDKLDYSHITDLGQAYRYIDGLLSILNKHSRVFPTKEFKQNIEEMQKSIKSLDSPNKLHDMVFWKSTGCLYIKIHGYLHDASVSDKENYETVSKFIENVRKKLIRTVKDNEVKGFIIDVSTNLGGWFLPMIMPYVEIFGLGTLLGYKSNSSKTKQYYNIEKKDMSYSITLTKTKKERTNYTSLPVVCIIGENTYSAGEITALALSGIPNCILIGHKTGGLLSMNCFNNFDNKVGVNITCFKVTDQHGKVLDKDYLKPNIKTDKCISIAKKIIKGTPISEIKNIA